MAEPILGALDGVTSWFSFWTGWHTLGLIGFLFLWLYEWAGVSTPEDAARQAEKLRGYVFQNYRKSLLNGLDGFSRWIGDKYDDGPRDFSAASFLVSWGWATIYPLLFLMLAWAFLETPGKIGNLVLFPDHIADWRRWLMIACFAASIMVPAYVGWRLRETVSVDVMDAITVAITVALAGAGAVAGTGGGPVAFAFAFAFTRLRTH